MSGGPNTVVLFDADFLRRKYTGFNKDTGNKFVSREKSVFFHDSNHEIAVKGDILNGVGLNEVLVAFVEYVISETDVMGVLDIEAASLAVVEGIV